MYDTDSLGTAKHRRPFFEEGAHALTGIGTLPGALGQGVDIVVGNLLPQRQSALDGGFDASQR